jgi:hypothetical protein
MGSEDREIVVTEGLRHKNCDCKESNLKTTYPDSKPKTRDSVTKE